jgi:hypothetical protein
MSKRQPRQKAAPPPSPTLPRQDSHPPLGEEGRGESHALPGVKSILPDDNEKAPFLAGTDAPSPSAQGGELRDCPTEGCTKPEGHKSPCGIMLDLTEAEVLEQAGSFGPLPSAVEPQLAGSALALIEAAERQQAAVRHLFGTTGLSVRREPDEKGSPRFTLLAVRVTEAGEVGVEVLVAVAPWHHLEDAIERFVRTTLTPREYR